MSFNRSPWSPNEDEILKSVIRELGVSKWGNIARVLNSKNDGEERTGKQCRERWHNHLDPEVTKTTWTERESTLMYQLHEVYGNHWSKIAKHLPGRSDNSVKNFYYSNLRKFTRQQAKENLESIQKRKRFRRKSKKLKKKIRKFSKENFDFKRNSDGELLKEEVLGEKEEGLENMELRSFETLYNDWAVCNDVENFIKCWTMFHVFQYSPNSFIFGDQLF